MRPCPLFIVKSLCSGVNWAVTASSKPFPQSLNVIQLDGAPAHIARDLEIPDNIVLLFQPAHSPELNPIEQLWLDFQIDLRGMNFSNLDGLQITIRQILESMTPEWIASLTGYHFILRALSDVLIT